MLQAWQHARKTDAASRRQQQVHHVAWQPPQAGVVKCNIDAAIFDTEQTVMTAAESEACIKVSNGLQALVIIK
jgi:hypothetical protein